jgi:hypothetical protein
MVNWFLFLRPMIKLSEGGNWVYGGLETEMFEHFWLVISALGLTLFVAGLAWRPIHQGLRRARFAEARRDFHRQRERLEARFLQLGIANSRPDAPAWMDCEFDDDVAYARSRSTGELSALVAVTISLGRFDEAAEEDRGEPPDQLRLATAVFRFDHGHWTTDGRAILNLSPAETIHFYQRELEMVGQECPVRPPG